MNLAALALAIGLLGLVTPACDSLPPTTVVLDNRYSPSDEIPLVVYRAYWGPATLGAAAFTSPVAPGASSDAQQTVPTSATTAYVVLAPGWDPSSATEPASLVLMESKDRFDVHLGGTLHIPVDDTTFVGHCAAQSYLSQAEADLIATRVLPLVLPPDAAALRYEATTCMAVPVGDAGTD